MCTLKSCQCILQTALDLGRTAQFTKKEQPAQRDTAQSQKATDSLRWDSNASIPHFCFQKIKNKKKSCFSTEKAKGGRLPGVPGQLELFISKQTNTHTLFQRKKKKREKERERDEKGSITKKKSLRETNTIKKNKPVSNFQCSTS